MYLKPITSIAQYDLTPEDNSTLGRVDTKTVNCVEFTVDGIAGATGSMIPQIQPTMDGKTVTPPNYKNVLYTNVATGVQYSAGTAITADGTYIADTPGNNLSMNVTACAGSFNIFVHPLQGPGPSGSSGGGAVSEADGANVALGTTTDTAVGDATGTLIAHARMSAKAAAQGAADNSTNSTFKAPVLIGTATAAAPTNTEGRQVPASLDLAGNLRAILPGAADNSTNSTVKVPVLDGTATAAAPGYTEGRQVSRSSDLAGNTRVIPAATEVHLGQIGGTTTNIAPTLAVTVAAYSANNCVGGLLTLTSAMRSSGNSGAWAKLTITDHANQKVALDVLLFKSSPAGTFTDKVAFPTMSAADNALVSARVSIATTDWVTMGGSAYCTKIVGPLPVTASGSANLYAAMATTGTPTYAATTDLNAIFGFFCD